MSILPSTGMASPGRTRRIFPFLTFEASISLLPAAVWRQAFWGVRFIRDCRLLWDLSAVTSSNTVPSCIIKATSPAAKYCPITSAAISAIATSKSAVTSNSVINPLAAPMIMGTPLTRMAIHAASNGSCGINLKKLIIKTMPESTVRHNMRNPSSFLNLSIKVMKNPTFLLE